MSGSHLTWNVSLYGRDVVKVERKWIILHTDNHFFFWLIMFFCQQRSYRQTEIIESCPGKRAQCPLFSYLKTIMHCMFTLGVSGGLCAFSLVRAYKWLVKGPQMMCGILCFLSKCFWSYCCERELFGNFDVFRGWDFTCIWDKPPSFPPAPLAWTSNRAPALPGVLCVCPGPRRCFVYLLYTLFLSFFCFFLFLRIHTVVFDCRRQ